MVLQYKLKTESERAWKDYPGKDKLEKSGGSVTKCDFRLLNESKSKILVKKGSYESVMKRFRQIEFFKHRGG